VSTCSKGGGRPIIAFAKGIIPIIHYIAVPKAQEATALGCEKSRALGVVFLPAPSQPPPFSPHQKRGASGQKMGEEQLLMEREADIL